MLPIRRQNITRIFIDSFDHDTDQPRNLRGEELDRHVLSTAKRVSVFWITETMARANRVQNWIDSKKLILDNSEDKYGYPWVGVTSFNPDQQ